MRTHNTSFSPAKGQVASGFSLLEMIAVLGIIALILGAAAVVVGRSGEGAAISTTEAMVKGIETKLMEYRRLGGGNTQVTLRDSKP